MDIITSVNNNHIKDLCRLKEKKYRDSTNIFLVEGDHLICEAYKEGLLTEVLSLEGNQISDISILEKMNITITKKLKSLIRIIVLI